MELNSTLKANRAMEEEKRRKELSGFILDETLIESRKGIGLVMDCN
jgi:hypothetical protein